MATENQWHLNKSVPIALIFAILVQSATIVWWASGVNSTVKNIESKIVQAEAVRTTNLLNLEAENLRQWGRINGAERGVQENRATLNTAVAILERLEAQVKDNNTLLKEYLRGTSPN